MTLLRWLLLLPSTVLSGGAVAMILVAISGLLVSSQSPNSMLFVSPLVMSIATAVAFLVARAVAPSGKNWVVIALAAVLIIMNLLELNSALRALDVPEPLAKDSLRIAEVIGFIATSLIFAAHATIRLRRASR